MPEPLPAGAGTPTDQRASAQPQSAADKQTTNTSDPLDNALGIPKDVQVQMAEWEKAKTQQQSPIPATAPEELPAEVTPEGEPAQQPQQQEQAVDTTASTTAEKDTGPDDDDDEDEVVDEHAQQEPQHVDKRQKRIGRLTRQRNEARQRAEALEQQLQQATAKEQPRATIPSTTGGRLNYITDENQLTQEVARSEMVVDWCDAHRDGRGLTENQIDPRFKQAYDKGELSLEDAASKTIAGWRTEAEKVLLSAPTRRDEIRTYSRDRGFFDNVAQQAWPELFDKNTTEYQLKNAILSEPAYSHLRGSAQENYAVGLAIEGMKSLQGRVAAASRGNPNSQIPNSNGNGRRDIDPRAFEPRVPIAPTTAEPPVRDSREAGAVSSRNKVNDAMNGLVRDPDGSAASLAAVLRAEEELAGATGGNRSGKTRVRI